MSLSVPHYIPVEKLLAMPIQHEWDDDDPYEALGLADEELASALAKVSDRAKKAFAIACAEWVIRRAGELSPPDPLPLDYLEASWAGLVDWELQRIWEPDQSRYMGPRAGPIDLAVRTVTNCHTALGMGSGEFDAAYVSRIAVYVMPDPSALLSWQKDVVPRVQKLYPRPESDPAGAPVPREAFDPAIPLSQLTPEKAADLCKAFVAALDFKRNKFLVAPSNR